ncbi:hypothetical protein SELMODRAFT_104389 [Selaginella moellendorffii]|uniref:Sec23/Sec24 trunk domain-containing protein n=1 Tax=Selaginella moellendorffii TaxID=88036 RepID=D8RY32_SELML|nr:hypothetical protein SELMODRAFT_104389 [Selaginella moellendorffii]
MAVRLALGRCPGNPEMQEASGLPWGATLTPFAAEDETGRPSLRVKCAEPLPRCDSCWGYMNFLCEVDQSAWSCVLCGERNFLSRDAADRFARDAKELRSSFVDLELEEEGSQDLNLRPVYVAAVDLSASEEFLDLVKNSLLAALEAIRAGSLFGLVTYSHKIGLYDVQGAVPVVKHVVIPADMDGKIVVDLEDVMPLKAFLAPVETNKENIAAALETLRPTSSWERATAAGQSAEGVPIGGRGFGVAMDALLSYLGTEHGSTYAFARIFSFISGAPDYGAGQLDTKRYGEQYASKGEDADKILLAEQTPFYRELAATAVQVGICVDIFAITNEYTDLASLKFLSVESGGSLFLYSNTEESTLPQDLYRMLSRPCAYSGVLRIRTSPEFKTVHSYGHFFSDPQYENVQHIICCDPHATYAYDFDFGNSSGFQRFTDTPIIQVAFQYTTLEPVSEEHEILSSRTESVCVRQKYTTKRWLRLRTLRMEIARNHKELYERADAEAIFCILTHKTIRASLEDGVKEGRLLLQDWLIILVAQYNELLKLAQFGQPTTAVRLDVSFAKCPSLQVLPRLAFAFLRNPVLRPHEEGVHPDYRVYLQFLFSALEPSSLVRVVYPLLSSYTSPDKQAYPRHSLSRAALITSGSPIFFLDAYTLLIVYYASTADPALSFPPPHKSALRELINKLKQERSVTPKLYMIRAGFDNVEPFERHLIEEQDVNGAPTGTGFVSFLDEIARSVLEHMK